MRRGVLLDANLLIKALDKKSVFSSEERHLARTKLAGFLRDDAVDVAITPLIRYEFLRHVEFEDSERYKTLEEAIAEFVVLDIKSDISDLATKLYQFQMQEDVASGTKRNLEKRKFDTFHLASAKCNNYELASDDSDIAKLELLYQRLLQARKNNSIQENTNNTNNEESA